MNLSKLFLYNFSALPLTFMKHSFTMFLWEKLPVSIFVPIFMKNLFPDQYLMNLSFMNRKLKFGAAVSPVEEKLFQRQFSGTNQMIFWWFKKTFDTVHFWNMFHRKFCRKKPSYSLPLHVTLNNFIESDKRKHLRGEITLVHFIS